MMIMVMMIFLQKPPTGLVYKRPRYLDTHELINLHISAMAYYINTLDGERSVHGR